MSSVQSEVVNLIARMVRNSFFIHKAETTTQRKSFERISNFTKFPRFVKSNPLQIGHLDAVSFQPKKLNKERIVLYLHGGAYVAGSVNTHRALIARVARAAKCEAIGIDYRLAPEHPYPAALDDSLFAYNYLVEKGYKSIFLAGDSAGGGLALATMLQLRDKGLQMPAGVSLISPWTDLAMTGESVKTKEHVDPLINPNILSAFAQKYIGDDIALNPLISPLYANLSNLSPVFIQVGGNELLLDDATRLAKKLKKAGCNVEMEVWDSMFHVWHYLGGLVPEAQTAINAMGNFIIQTYAETKSVNKNQLDVPQLVLAATN
jgi:monoterpene epsilon-lactone hydrolase